jgi:hypothetical protein
MKRILSEKPTSNPEPSVVIVGTAKSSCATAAWFDGADAPQANVAATEVGFQVLQLANDEQKRLAAKLPHGRLRKDGKPHVSRVSASALDVLAQLKRLTNTSADDLAAAGQPDPEKTQASEIEVRSAPEPSPSNRLPAALGAVAPVRMSPHDFDEVGPGSLVLARDDEAEAWYEAIVVLAQNDHFWLRWRDYPRERQIQRKRNQLALLYSKAA